MPRRDFQDSLDALRADVVDMAAVVLDRLDNALGALDAGDADAAEAVIDGDTEINDLYLELESACIDLFALHQPVASDLRFVAASFKILTDLERVGDLAANLAGYALAADTRYLPDVDLTHIGARAHGAVADAIAAYADRDAAACREIDARDDEIDALCHAASEHIVRDLIERRAAAGDSQGTPWDVEAVLDDVSRVLLTLRDLERVADHGVNIAARTLYAVDNDPELIY
ncbi:phosphate transport system regulatory protein PhoU [Halobellus salinus]|uniref:Phosphate-specific transport system accessory protein PhoU n=1 Tax=Halobellus salinus TaxID=931585 RepID=A0A830EAP6_9EURY|nr:phosphate signaling complex protein PhoU [Halobellus salinus]GGJ06635.1 phosphate transport system regulatory protein PhoU [Halobellus salinus]SMP15002.1 phosphate transport system protein [Halobellus salinus]